MSRGYIPKNHLRVSFNINSTSRRSFYGHLGCMLGCAFSTHMDASITQHKLNELIVIHLAVA